MQTKKIIVTMMAEKTCLVFRIRRKRGGGQQEIRQNSQKLRQSQAKRTDVQYLGENSFLGTYLDKGNVTQEESVT